MDSSSEHVTASINGPLSNLYHGTWPVERGLWQSGPSSLPSSSNHVSIYKNLFFLNNLFYKLIFYYRI